MDAIWHKYGSYMVIPYSCHIDTMWQAYGLAICMSYSVNMRAILFSHVACMLIPYDRHMAKPYACRMVSIWQPYGYTIWLPHGYHMAGIWFSHMEYIWGLGCKPHLCPYARHMTLHMAYIWVTYDNAIGEALTRGRTDQFSNICILWPWTATYHFGFRIWSTGSTDESACQVSRSKVI